MNGFFFMTRVSVVKKESKISPLRRRVREQGRGNLALPESKREPIFLNADELRACSPR